MAKTPGSGGYRRPPGGEEEAAREAAAAERSEIMRRAGPYMTLGTMFVASIGLGIAAGYWLDGKLGTKPWLTLAGALLGLGLGFYHFIVVVTHRPPD